MLMNRTSYFSTVVMLLTLFMLTACNNSPLDRKLDYNDLNKSFNAVLKDAKPEEKALLEKYSHDVFGYVDGVRNASNPEVSGRAGAKQMAEALEKLKQMTVRELYKTILTQQEKGLSNNLSTIKDALSNLHVKKVDVEEIRSSGYHHTAISGSASLQNTSSSSFIIDSDVMAGIELDDGRVIRFKVILYNKSEPIIIKKGETKIYSFGTTLDNEHHNLALDILKQGKKLKWLFDFSNLERGAIVLHNGELMPVEKYKWEHAQEELQRITTDLKRL